MDRTTNIEIIAIIMVKRKKGGLLTNKMALVKTVGHMMGKKVRMEPGKPSVLKNPIEDNRVRLQLKEKKALLEAYNQHGFHFFQNLTLLKAVLPNKSELEIKGIIDSYKRRSQSKETPVPEENLDKPLHEWQNFISQSVSNFDKKINLDEIYTDVLRKMCDHFVKLEDPSKEQLTTENPTAGLSSQQADRPDYVTLYSNFIQLLEGKFPQKPSQLDAALITCLFRDLKNAGSRREEGLNFLDDGKWLTTVGDKLKSEQELARGTLAVVEANASFNDLKNSIELRTLYREFPKISRITKKLNPLYFPVEELANVLSN